MDAGTSGDADVCGGTVIFPAPRSGGRAPSFAAGIRFAARPMDPTPAEAPAPGPTPLPPSAFVFLLATAFLGSMGIGLIGPVVPYLVEPYLADASRLGSTVGWLTASYAICSFLAGPPIGAISDRYGRRPVLLVSLVGSAVGYLLFGLGGSLGMLFLGRIVDGITAGNFSAVFGAVADTTAPEKRAIRFGQMGAAFGAGFIVGPAVGGLATHLTGHLNAPVYVAAALAALSALWGTFVMPETMAAQNRATAITARSFNPLAQLGDLLALPPIRALLIAAGLFVLPFAMLTTTLALLGKEVLDWTAAQASTVFVVVGAANVVVQGFLLGTLVRRWGELRVARGAVGVTVLGLALLALVPVLESPLAMYVGAAVFAIGEGVFTASLSGLLSRRAGGTMQGRVQGGSQAMQSLARVIGPIAGGQLFQRVGPGAPYAVGLVLVALAGIPLFARGASEGGGQTTDDA